MCIVYSTDSEEHLINTGEIPDPQWDYLTEQEIYEDVNSMNNYLDDIFFN